MSIIKKLINPFKKAPLTPQESNEHYEAQGIQVTEIDLIAFNHNLAKFFSKQFNLDQLEGTNLIIDQFFKAGLSDIRWLSYMLATAWHETGFTMRPVTEYGSEKYLREKPYWPYIGRGYVQITHKENYEKYGIDKKPELALEPEMACYILIHGMVNGVFTGRQLRHYFNETGEDPFNARKIINGLDRAARIVEYYQKFLIVLKNSTYEY